MILPGGANSEYTIPLISKKQMSIVFMFDLTSAFLGHGEVTSVPLAKLLFCFGVMSVVPKFISGYDFGKKSGTTSKCSFKAWHIAKRLSLYSGVSKQGTNFAETHFMPKSSDKIHWQELRNTPFNSTSSSIGQWQSSKMAWQILATFSLVQLVKGCPEWGWSSVDISPHLKWENHL